MPSSPPASFDSLRAALHDRYERLSPHLQRIARFALDDPNRFALGTVANIALATDVQPSSIVRLAQAFGYRGFSDMQRVFKVRLIEGAPDYRERILEQRSAAAPMQGDDPLALLHEFADANAQTLAELKNAVTRASLCGALDLIRNARDIYVIGLRRAFPLAAYVFYGLVRSEFRCHLLDVVGGMVPQQVATMTTHDLLVAVSFAEYAPLTVDVVQDAHIRGIPALAITDTEVSPLARQATLAFIMRDPAVHPLRSLAAPMCLAQSLVAALQSRPRSGQGRN
ncbi:MAG TPA: MurR/RpiR family transcriptional regulator, partial [Steroidobacteraceae bacterium]|nr:MurR/RpiR family transcriptional regulator [Steroidobacteraceae bacterium]